MIAPARETVEPRLLVTKDVAATMLSVDPRTLQRWTWPNGDLRCIRIGTGKNPLLRYRLSDIEAWIDRQYASQRTKEGDGPQIVRLVEHCSELTETKNPEH